MRENICKGCNMSFGTREELQEHNAKAHGTSPNVCRACGATFKSALELREHAQAAHRL